MAKETVDIIWQHLEEAARNIEQMNGDIPAEEQKLADAMGLLMKCEPALILERVESGPWPARAVVSWLVFEASRLGLGEEAETLAGHWSARPGAEPLIPPPPQA